MLYGKPYSLRTKVRKKERKEKRKKERRKENLSPEVQFWDRINTVTLKAPMPTFPLVFSRHDGGNVGELFCILSVFSEIKRVRQAAMESLFADMWLYDVWLWSARHDTLFKVFVVVGIYLFIFTASCFYIHMHFALLGGMGRNLVTWFCRMRSSQLSAAKSFSCAISRGLDYLVF